MLPTQIVPSTRPMYQDAGSVKPTRTAYASHRFTEKNNLFYFIVFKILLEYRINISHLGFFCRRLCMYVSGRHGFPSPSARALSEHEHHHFLISEECRSSRRGHACRSGIRDLRASVTQVTASLQYHAKARKGGPLARRLDPEFGAPISGSNDPRAVRVGLKKWRSKWGVC